MSEKQPLVAKLNDDANSQHRTAHAVVSVRRDDGEIISLAVTAERRITLYRGTDYDITRERLYEERPDESTVA